MTEITVPSLHTSETKVLDTALIEAIKDEELQKVEDWIGEVGADGINSMVDDRVLTYASGNSEVSSKGMTALHYAAFYSKIEIVTALLKAGADPTLLNEAKENALQCAVQSEYEDKSIAEVTDLLLRDSAGYIDYVTDSKWTALLMAVHLNHPLTVERLLHHGADPSIDVEAGEDKYRYSLALAALHEGPILKALLDTGKCDVNWKDGKYTALHLAVKFFKPDNVKVLVDKKADIFAKDFFRMCPIHYCIGATSNSDFESIVSCLKRSINEQDDTYGYTLLHSCVIQGKTEYVRILRHKFNAGYSRKDNKERIPIHYLYHESYVQDLVDLLGDTDATINAKDKRGLTPLQYAVKNGDASFVQCLIENRANYNVLAKYKQALIHLATITPGTDKDFETMVNVLRRIPNFDVNQRDAHGATALHYALDSRRFSRAKTLLEVGADPALTDKGLKNSLHQAFRRNCPGDIVRTILEKGRGLESALDSDKNTPLQYMNAMTPLSAVKALEEFGVGEETDGGVSVEVTLKYGKRKRVLELPTRVSAEILLEHAMEKFERTDLQVEQYNKDSDSWMPVDENVQLAQNETLEVKEKATKGPPLNQAIELDRLDMVKLLLVKGMVLDVGTLTQAIVKEDEELARILVRHAWDIKTPLTQVIPQPSYIEDTHHHPITPHPQNGQTTTLFRELIQRMPSVAKEALERCIQLGEDHKFTLDFTYLFPTNSNGDIRTVGAESGSSDESDNILQNPLELMVKSKRTELLQHPVVWTYLYLMWNALGFWFYSIKLFVYVIFLICLSLFVLVVNDPQSIHCTANASSDSDIGCGSTPRRAFSYIFAALVILLGAYHLVIDAFRLIYHFKVYFKKVKYFRKVKNYCELGLELVLYLSSVLFVFNFVNPCGCTLDWQWQLGIFVVFLGWMNLVFYASKFPRTGIFVLVFKEILLTFLSLVAFGLLLVVAFSLILYMMFYSPTATITSFSNIGQSFVKTVTMVTGELGYESLFRLDVPPDSYSPIPYFVSGFIMWIIFLVLIPIILNNMLVSLAVGDAKEVIENAELQKLILQVRTVVLSEEVVPQFFKNYALGHIRTKMSIDLVKQMSFWNKLRLFIFGGINYQQTLENYTYAQRRKEEQEEIRGQRVTDDGSMQRMQDEILQRLDQLFDLVMTNEECIKKCQKHDQNMMRIIGKLAR